MILKQEAGSFLSRSSNHKSQMLQEELQDKLMIIKQNIQHANQNEFKKAFHQYHSQNKVGYNGFRQQLKDVENQKQQEALSLVKNLKKEKDQRLQNQRLKVQNMIQKQADALSRAQLEFISARRGQTSLVDQAGQNNNLLPSVSPKRDIADLFELGSRKKKQKYNEQINMDQQQQKMKLLEIKSQHRPLEHSELLNHQRQYDDRLKERAYAAGGNLFKQQRKITLDQVYQDIEFMSDEEDLFGNKSRKKQSNNSRINSNRSNIYSTFDRQKAVAREKEDRRNNYAKYIKEINLPLELDRDELKREASSYKKQWAEQFLEKNGQYLTNHEKIEFIQTNAQQMEEKALRYEAKIRYPKEIPMHSQMYNQQIMSNVYQNQQIVGDKLVEAIRSKLALLDNI
ncbi:UNKNOWN [Stylonychia lemnae]|uniref:Uncharacterized protein n=1 Tax=Stylonychia lemnae TaxID=5949 RepID=A0A078ABG7_STYLE|nr:UNKNOWN [Stylonychia lemnae]|eukprot:CDW79529.1 UNKNOWN [Stylonychia lemnae]